MSESETAGAGDEAETGASCPVGSEGCACTLGGACDPGLVCASGLCVELPGGDGDPSGDGDGDPSGDGDGDPSGDGDGDPSGDGDGDPSGDGDGDPGDGDGDGDPSGDGDGDPSGDGDGDGDPLGDCTAISWPKGSEQTVVGAMSYPQAWTIEGWVRVAALPIPDNTGDYGTIVGIDANEQCSGTQEWAVRINASGSLLANMPTYTTEPSTAVVTPGQWHHFALVIAGNNAALYVDGALAQSFQDGQQGWLTSCPLRIGNNQGSANHFLAADLASLRMSATHRYDAPFVPSAILADDADTEWLFEFDEGAGVTAAEASGPLVATLENVTWLTEGPACP